MRDVILRLLQVRFVGARPDGLRVLARSLALQAATEEEAQKVVEALTQANVDDYIKEFRSDVDKEVTESVKKVSDKMKVKEPEPTPGGIKPGEEKPAADDIQSLIAAAVKPLTDQLASMQTAGVQHSRESAFAKKLESCTDEMFKTSQKDSFGYMQFKDEESFNTYIEGLDKHIQTANQGVIDQKLANAGQPFRGSVAEDGISAAMHARLEEKVGKGEASMGGKEL